MVFANRSSVGAASAETSSSAANRMARRRGSSASPVPHKSMSNMITQARSHSASKVHPSSPDKRASAREARRRYLEKWPRRLSVNTRRLSLPRFTGAMRGTTAAALDPLRRNSVQRVSLSSSGSLVGHAWYKEDDVRSQPTEHW